MSKRGWPTGSRRAEDQRRSEASRWLVLLDNYSGITTREVSVKASVLAKALGLRPSYVQQLKGGAAQRVEEARKQGAKSTNDDLGESQQARPRDIGRVAEGCAFIKETLDKGGANLVNEPQWHDMATLASYCADPDGTMVRLCERGPNYDYEKRSSSSPTPRKPAPVGRAASASPSALLWKVTAQSRSAMRATTSNTPSRRYMPKPTSRPSRGRRRARQCRTRTTGWSPKRWARMASIRRLPGGWYDPSDENVERLNRRFCLVNEGPDTLWYENRGPAGLDERPEKDLQRGLGNVFPSGADPDAKRRGEKAGTSSRLVPRTQGKKPAATGGVQTQPAPASRAGGEFNMWQGWGVDRIMIIAMVDAAGQTDRRVAKTAIGRVDAAPSLRTDCVQAIRATVSYALNWHGWVFQNWGTPAHTIPILQGRRPWHRQEFVVRVAGAARRRACVHVSINKEHLLGKHAVHEYLCLAILDDIIVERDHKAQDVDQGDWRPTRTRMVEPKGRAQRKIVNRVTMAGDQQP